MPRYKVRVPFADLERAARCEVNAELAAMVGVDRRQVARWRHDGGVPIQSADQIAVRLGMHPTEIWGHNYYAAWDQWDTLISDCHRRRLERNRRRKQELRDDALGLAYVLQRIHVSWWEADARRVLNEEWAA